MHPADGERTGSCSRSECPAVRGHAVHDRATNDTPSRSSGPRKQQEGRPSGRPTLPEDSSLDSESVSSSRWVSSSPREAFPGVRARRARYTRQSNGPNLPESPHTRRHGRMTDAGPQLPLAQTSAQATERGAHSKRARPARRQGPGAGLGPCLEETQRTWRLTAGAQTARHERRPWHSGRTVEGRARLEFARALSCRLLHQNEA